MRIVHEGFNDGRGYLVIREELERRFGPDHTVSDVRQLYNELFARYTWPGSYPMLFTDDYGSILCAECARRAFITDREDITVDIYYEGPELYCDECGRRIESAYGVGGDE
jgi:hypothetical protein